MDYETLIASMFTYHKPTDNQAAMMAELQGEHVTPLAHAFDSMAPDGPAKTIALRKLHEARQAMNYAILGGK